MVKLGVTDTVSDYISTSGKGESEVRFSEALKGHGTFELNMERLVS